MNIFTFGVSGFVGRVRGSKFTATCSEKLSVTCAWCLLFTFVYYREREHKRTLQSALVIAKVRFKVMRLAASRMISVILHCLCFSG